MWSNIRDAVIFDRHKRAAARRTFPAGAGVDRSSFFTPLHDGRRCSHDRIILGGKARLINFAVVDECVRRSTEKPIKLSSLSRRLGALRQQQRCSTYRRRRGASPNTCRAESELATAQSRGARSTPPADAG